MSILIQLEKRRAQIMSEMFNSPPTDWAGFKERFGRWLECTQTVKMLEEEAEAEEERLNR